jgi:hypothetical protein
MPFNDPSSESSSDSDSDSGLDIQETEDGGVGIQILLEPPIPPAADLSVQQLREVSFKFSPISVPRGNLTPCPPFPF